MTTSIDSAARPFAEGVAAYVLAGWPAVMPVPVSKAPPPEGFTGEHAPDPTQDKLAEWIGSHGASSIALRMPAGVIGIDVDAYAKGQLVKHGERTLDETVSRYGLLPPTWSSTARGEGPSRISFYRVPVGKYATKLAGGDVEIIQRHHRYAVVWPSPHPEVGALYRWYDPAGVVSDRVPRIEELAVLPPSWAVGLAEGAAGPSVTSSSHEAGQTLLDALADDTRPACPDFYRGMETTRRELAEADAGSRHDVATERTHHLVHLGAKGHHGLGASLDELRHLWDAITPGEDRGEEFERMLLTTARKAVTATGPRPVANDPCALIGGVELARPIQQGPRPDDNRPDAPVQPRRDAELHPHEVIGLQLGPFDPRAGLDQTLAEKVIERVHPVLRYAYDGRVWLRRQRVVWEVTEDLGEWAVAKTAELMPPGDPDAEKGSDAFEQAARRKRFMSASPASAVARKMRAVLAGGAHPAALRLADVDAEPWLLWAGGVPWDLGASLVEPVAAQADPDTPHLRAAGYLPELRETPLWDAFTAAVWPDVELRRWALRVLAIAFTGYADRALPVLIGEANRGKTQVITLLMDVLGNYAHAADPRLLTSADNAHASIVFALKGRRLSFIDEAPRDSRSGQERLKQLTGGGELTGNMMRANPVTFAPTHTLILTANEPPLLTDPAVRSRVRLIPCQGDPAEVIATRAAIGHVAGDLWRREAPGVLTAMMREAAAWLADPASSATAAAPEAYRFIAEEMAAEQDVTRRWLDDACEVHQDGSRIDPLHVSFIAWCGDHGIRQPPSPTKWARDLTALGYPPIKRNDANYRGIRVRSNGSFLWPREVGVNTSGGFASKVEGSEPKVEGSKTNPPPPKTQDATAKIGPELPVVEGVEALSLSTTHAHARAHAHMGRQPENTLHPPLEGVSSASSPVITGETDGGGSVSQPSTGDYVPHSARLSASFMSARAEPPAAADAQSSGQAPARRGKLSDAEKAERKAARDQVKADERAQARLAAIAEAGGPVIELPAVVDRTLTVAHIDLANVRELLTGLGALELLTVDVEHTGYPVGHAEYRLRTIQLGNALAAVVLDAADPEQVALAGALINEAIRLGAHSAIADLVPLAFALPEFDYYGALTKMADTALQALIADPTSTGSDADALKELSRDVLGPSAASTAATAGRVAVFKAGGWLTKTNALTPVARSGWAQIEHRSTTMIRYAAADVLDSAALGAVLPAMPPAVAERERVAQMMTATVARKGVRIDGDHVRLLIGPTRAALADAGDRLRALGVADPGSDLQVAVGALSYGATLPMTPGGRASVAKGALDPFKAATGPLGDLVRARLDYQHHETQLGTFLEPYLQLVEHGDGRARPTIYTLGADTGRMSCVRPNLQQVPREGGIRSCLTADPGELIVSADFASVEIRVMAALSQDPTLMRMLADGADIHGLIAAEVFGPEWSKGDRYTVKRGVFGWAYGGGIATLAAQVGVSQSVMASVIDVLAAMAPRYVEWSNEIKRAVRNGHTQFPSYAGRIIHLPPAFPHKAPNYCVQGTARELLVDTLVKWQHTRWARCVLLPVHDEVLVFVPEAEAAEAQAELIRCMESDLFGVAITAEPSAPSFAWKDAS